MNLGLASSGGGGGGGELRYLVVCSLSYSMIFLQVRLFQMKRGEIREERKKTLPAKRYVKLGPN